MAQKTTNEKGGKLMKKTLSLILAILMIMATMPMVLAADPIALTEANITVFPTYEGSIYFGQQIKDGITITGGEVQYNGTVVPGRFEIVNVDEYPVTDGTNQTLYKFIPDDTNTYSEFTIEEWGNAYYMSSYNVITVTPKLVDESDMPVAANKVVAGKKLSTCKLSGGTTIYNPYYPEEPNALAAVWKWTKSSTIVNESGFYEARIRATGYETQTTMVWVNIEGDDTQPVYPAEIVEYPTFPEMTYNPNSTLTYSDLFSGGKAVIKGTDTEISGKFEIEGVHAEMAPYPTHKSITFKFTPDDQTIASWVSFSVPVTVNKTPVAFLDENGNAVTEGFVFEVEPNEKINNIKSQLYSYIQMPANSVYRIETDDTYAVNGKEYMLYVIHSDSNYVGSEIYFTVKFKETVVEPKIVGIGNNRYRLDCGSYSLPGTFAVAIMKDGALVDTIVTKSGEEFKFEPTASGKYTFNVAYAPTEGDYFVVDAFSKEYDIALNWTATIDSKTFSKKCGETVEASATNTGVIGWTATDAAGNPIELTLVSGTMESETFTFIMPDTNVVLTPQYETADDGNGDFDLDLGDIDGIDGLLDWLRSLIEKIKGIFEKIIAFFQSIGDMT